VSCRAAPISGTLTQLRLPRPLSTRETGQLVDTYARSKFEDTRAKATKFGAHGTTVKAYKPSGGL
jgi:hypothetical protein